MSCCDSIKPSEMHCAACHQTFGTLRLFDAHQDVDYDRSQPVLCRVPEAMGAVRDTRGTWQTPEGLAARSRASERLAERRRQAVLS